MKFISNNYIFLIPIWRPKHKNHCFSSGWLDSLCDPSFPLFNAYLVNVMSLAIDTIHSPGVVGFTGFNST